MCTDENDEEELTKMCVPCVGKGTTNQAASRTRCGSGFMKEFDCKIPSTWSVCGRKREEAFTYKPNKKLTGWKPITEE